MQNVNELYRSYLPDNKEDFSCSKEKRTCKGCGSNYKSLWKETDYHRRCYPCNGCGKTGVNHTGFHFECQLCLFCGDPENELGKVKDNCFHDLCMKLSY